MDILQILGSISVSCQCGCARTDASNVRFCNSNSRFNALTDEFYWKSRECDGVKDCANGIDESNCRGGTRAPPTTTRRTTTTRYGITLAPGWTNFLKNYFEDELPLRGVPPLPDALLQPGVPQLHDVRLQQQQQLLQGLHERLPDLLNVAQNLKLIIFGSISSMKIFMFLLMDGLSKNIGWFSTWSLLKCSFTGSIFFIIGSNNWKPFKVVLSQWQKIFNVLDFNRSMENQIVQRKEHGGFLKKTQKLSKVPRYVLEIKLSYCFRKNILHSTRFVETFWNIFLGIWLQWK